MAVETRGDDRSAASPAPPVVAPPPGHPRFPLIDSLRAIAVTCVLLTHTGALSGANERSWFGAFTARMDVGVTIFFVISGFLLYRPFVHVRMNGARPTRLVDYARRRFLRIFPAYWLALTVLAIVPGLPRVFSGDWWVYYGLFQAYDPAWFDKGIGAAWSLSTEIAFYLVLPLYALAAARLLAGRPRARQVRVELGALALLGAGSVVARALVQSADRNAAFGHESTFPITLGGTFLWFAAGMALAVVSASLHDRVRDPAPLRFVARRPWAPWLAAATCFALASEAIGLPRGGLTRATVAQLVGEHLLFGAAAVCLLLPAVIGEGGGGWPRRVLASRAPAWLGLVSYGVFLWHLPVAVRLSSAGAHGFLPLTIATAAIAVPAAAASYYVLERPVLRLKYRRLSASAGSRPPAGTSGG